jgi:hypothetical protein
MLSSNRIDARLMRGRVLPGFGFAGMATLLSACSAHRLRIAPPDTIRAKPER